MLATDVRASQFKLVSEEVRQEHARGHVAVMDRPID